MASDKKTIPEEQQLLSLPETARVFGVSRGTVRNMVLRGDLKPVVFLGVQRIPRREVNRRLAELGAL